MKRRIVWGDKEVAMTTWKVDAAHSLPVQVPSPPCLSQMSLLNQGTGISLLSLNLTSDFMASISCASCFHFPSPLFDCKLLEGSAEFFFFFYMFGSYTRAQCLKAQKPDLKNKNPKSPLLKNLASLHFLFFSFSLVS